MSDEPLTNAAVREWQRSMEVANTADGPREPSQFRITVDYVNEDRRTGIAHTYDRTEFVDSINELHSLTSGQPHLSDLEIITVRGERCMAVANRLDYGNGMYVEFIQVHRLDAELYAVERTVCVDIDARDEAIAVLDEWHAEIGD